VSIDYTKLPAGLPVPEDDGTASHLTGKAMPPHALPATDGAFVRVDVVPEGMERLVLYAYPRTGRPDEEPLTPDWDLIPGARGCTPESCGFRDHRADLEQARAAVAGVSTEPTDVQRGLVERLGLPFPLLSDADLALTRALDLPTFTVAGHTLLKRLTMVIRDGVVEHVFYPVFPPDIHAQAVLEWVLAHPLGQSGSQANSIT
jgi:peroxiredoxin